MALYNKKIKELERSYLFDAFGTSLLTNAELKAKPMVMMVGQYSTGKPPSLRPEELSLPLLAKEA